jgi:hypothetical protein
MFRIDNATAAALAAPTVAGPNPDKYFTDGDPGGGIPATILPAEWANMVQEEIAGLIEASGLTLDKSDRAQMQSAVLMRHPAYSAVSVAADGDELLIRQTSGGAVKRITMTDLFTDRLGKDDTARDMAAAALAQADAAGTAGPKGPFELADPFTADSLAVKTNATYDAANDWYHNPSVLTTLSATAKWTGATGSFTFTGDDVDSNGTSDSAIRITDTLTGDFEYRFTWDASEHTWFGIYPTSEDGTFNGLQSNDAGNASAMTNSFFAKNTTTTTFETKVGGSVENASAFSAAASDVLGIKRVGSTITIHKNGSTIYTFTATSSVDMRIFVGTISVDSPAWADFSWDLIVTPDNMTLRPSAAAILTADPADTLAYFGVDPVSALAMGTDVIGKVSIDGGSTWATGTWTQIGGFGTAGEEFWRLDADVSAQSGSSLIYEITTLNNKEIRLGRCAGVVPLY